MKLNKPTNLVFWIAVILAVLAVLTQFMTIPVISSYAFGVLLIGYVLLVLGNLLKGF